jgi:hypothetical protein
MLYCNSLWTLLHVKQFISSASYSIVSNANTICRWRPGPPPPPATGRACRDSNSFMQFFALLSVFTEFDACLYMYMSDICCVAHALWLDLRQAEGHTAGL